MTGQEHYEAAERELAYLERVDADTRQHLAKAQVHATLALAAFQALASEATRRGQASVTEFVEASMGDNNPRIAVQRSAGA